MDEKKQMNRRDFLKIVGISTVGATAAFYGCTPDKKKSGESTKEVPVGKMTYRQFPPNEDKVSLLGYGCMRFPVNKDHTVDEVATVTSSIRKK